jgi:hypothetical protein
MKTPKYYSALRKRWERVHEDEKLAFCKEEKVERARGSEVMAALAAMYYATGLEVYRAALQALQEDGFDHARAGAYTPLWEKNAEKIYADRMQRLIQRGRSKRHAAASVAVDFWVRGETFDAAVARIEAAYRKAHR